jgi:hypothetical protein
MQSTPDSGAKAAANAVRAIMGTAQFTNETLARNTYQNRGQLHKVIQCGQQLQIVSKLFCETNSWINNNLMD